MTDLSNMKLENIGPIKSISFRVFFTDGRSMKITTVLSFGKPAVVSDFKEAIASLFVKSVCMRDGLVSDHTAHEFFDTWTTEGDATSADVPLFNVRNVTMVEISSIERGSM
jgi:hypothetical protein